MSKLPLRLSVAILAEPKYDEASKTLSVIATGGQRYEFKGVPPEIYRAFMGADNKQRYFDAHINGHFPDCKAHLF